MIISEIDLVRSTSRASFKRFVKEFWLDVPAAAPLRWNWHMDLMCDDLQSAAEAVFENRPTGGDRIWNISPGTSKSTIFSMMFHPWTWTRAPWARHLTLSHTDKLSLDFANKSRALINSEKYQVCFPEIILRDDQDTKGYYANTLGGTRYSVTVGGTSPTGQHAHFITGDDLIDPMKAFSEVELEAANNTWDQMSSRRMPGCWCLISLIMQRLHQDDPTAHSLEKWEDVVHNCLPCTVEWPILPKAWKRYYDKDGFMDQSHLNQKKLDEALKRLGQYGFAGQYGQQPVPLGGGMFHTDDLRLGQLPPNNFKRIVRAWDKAGTASGGAWTVGCKMGIDGDGRFWILDIVRGQWDSFKREQVVKNTAQMDGKHVVVIFEVEPGSGGKESAENSVRNLPGYRIRTYKPGASEGSKQTRADPFSSQVNGGNVYLAPGNWHGTFIDELKHFPNSKYKDQVDAASIAFIFLDRKLIVLGGMPVNSTPR